MLDPISQFLNSNSKYALKEVIELPVLMQGPFLPPSVGKDMDPISELWKIESLTLLSSTMVRRWERG
jgi:hypothetical protein